MIGAWPVNNDFMPFGPIARDNIDLLFEFNQNGEPRVLLPEKLILGLQGVPQGFVAGDNPSKLLMGFVLSVNKCKHGLNPFLLNHQSTRETNH